MLNKKGNLTDYIEPCFSNRQVSLKTSINKASAENPSGINIEISYSFDLINLISGVAGFVWATKDNCQAEIICNALKVQKIGVETVKVELGKNDLYLIKVHRREDVKEVIDFIQNDAGGLRLKPDWNYPEGERNQSFEQWINE